MPHASEVPAGDGRGGTPRRFLIVATSGGGGDLQPLLALAAGLRARGHQVAAFGDAAACAAMARLGVETTAAGSEHDLAGQLDPSVAAERIVDRLVAWSGRLAPLVERAAEAQAAEVLVASLFGAAAAHLVAARRGLPWAAVNSTFYIGPNPPRPPELDFGPRAAVFHDFFAPGLDRATLALHASDRAFDLGFDGLPAHHRYVGPLLWDPPGADRPPWLDEPGPPWALVTLSSHTQDDLPIARAALAALRDLPVRVLLTLGGHAGQDLGPVPANARVERHVPHGPVLDRAALLVGHAGHGSVMRALWHGVPMALVPWGRDQGGVAYRAERLGMAAVVPRGDLTAERLAAAARAGRPGRHRAGGGIVRAAARAGSRADSLLPARRAVSHHPALFGLWRASCPDHGCHHDCWDCWGQRPLSEDSSTWSGCGNRFLGVRLFRSPSSA